MKPNEKKPLVVFRIIDKETGEPTGSYSRACCDEYDFESVSHARHANCHGIFKDKKKYNIAKYRVTYTLIDDDCDPITPLEMDPKNWVEDFPHENGNYLNNCVDCGSQFLGHKRRVQCKVCFDKMVEEMTKDMFNPIKIAKSWGFPK
ncbi:hypothetical protein HN682_07690 [Candidatus Peregrinibacteria bacterium]|jgi:hypothetical protein|nr:hypothetical protein [Candidatus Peregrinibacteria bacterium]